MLNGTAKLKAKHLINKIEQSSLEAASIWNSNSKYNGKCNSNQSFRLIVDHKLDLSLEIALSDLDAVLVVF